MTQRFEQHNGAMDEVADPVLRRRWKDCLLLLQLTLEMVVLSERS